MKIFAKWMSVCFFMLFFTVFPSVTKAGKIETRGGKTTITLKLWYLPEPTRSDIMTKANYAVVKEFKKRFPKMFAEKYSAKYQANPQKYGKYNWDNVDIELTQFSGITIEGQGMDSKILMAIAGGVAPDVIYVNFRQSDTYIRQGFVYPLDKPEDNYLSSLTKEQIDFRINSKIWPVIRRKGPKGEEHVWAMPVGGILGKVMLYRKDLLEANGIPYPTNDWTWDDLMEDCKKLTNPAKGTYGISLGKGKSESWYWVTYLWSAGGEVMKYNEKKDEWRAAYDSPEAAVALDFYTRLTSEIWYSEDGKKRYGYAARETEERRKWEVGQIGFRPSYIDEKLFADINPDILGMVAVPKGPTGKRGGELNSRMQGIFGGIKNPVIRDMAWEYMNFCDCKEAVRIRTKMMVEGGMGRFVNPLYLRMFGYDDIIRLAPKGWEETFKIAIDTGKPEPYGRNCQLVYYYMTDPIREAHELEERGKLPKNREARLKIFRDILIKSVKNADEKMVGIISEKEMNKRRLCAVFLLIAIIIAFGLLFRKIYRAFSPPKTEGVKDKGGWEFRKFYWGYFLILPAAFTILFWRYIPLFIGSAMAFQDYNILKASEWVGLDNFANILWDGEWWSSVWNSLRYSFLVIFLTFIPPVFLAVMLQEVPKGKILFRTIFYLPRVITALVVIYMWKSFYEPNEFGVLNRIMLSIPAIGYILIGALMFYIMFSFAKRLYIHHVYWVSVLCFLAGIALFIGCYSFAHPILLHSDAAWYIRPFVPARDAYRWLDNSSTAMLCCVIPSIWAGMGPGCLIYLAALKGIAPDFYEAADIDGATFLDKILFIVIPILKPLLIIQFVAVFIAAWKNTAFILAMTGGGSNTEVAGLRIFYEAYMFQRFGPATAMAWILGFMLIGFTVHQLRILSKLEFKTTGGDKK